MKIRKTSDSYHIDMSIRHSGNQTKLVLQLKSKDNTILVREQTYEATGLGLLLETEFYAVVDTIVSDMETL
jgi:hypothetical protein